MIRLSLFLALALPLLAEDGPQTLRIHWEPGNAYTQETVTDTTMQRDGETGSGQLMRVTQNTELKVAKDKKSKDHIVAVKFASVRGEIEADGKTLTFDSTAPADQQNPILKQALGGSVGKTFSLVYDENDRFRDVRGLGDLAADAGSLSSLSSMASSREVALLYRKSLEMGLPPVPVNVSDTWTADETMAFPKAGEVRVKMNGKFVELLEREGRKHAKIEFEGKFGNTAERKDKPVSMIEITSNSTIAGILLYDLERRIVSFAAYTSNIHLLAPGGGASFEQKVTSKTKLADKAK